MIDGNSSILERLVSKRRILKSGCWRWIGAKNAAGYGVVAVHGECFVVHRLSWTHFKGSIDPDKRVLQSCDDRACFNPDHLFQGPPRWNTKIKKVDLGSIRKRRKSGVSLHAIAADYGVSPMTILRHSIDCGRRNVRMNPTQVREIRRRYSGGEQTKSIAFDFGITNSGCWQIATFKNWRHIK